MNKTFKLTLVFVAVVAIALFAQSGAWAGKMQSGDQAPSVAVNEAGARPVGTTSSGAKYIWAIHTSGVLVHEVSHLNFANALNVGRPDGTYFEAVYPNDAYGVLVFAEVGPGWHGNVSCWTGAGWYPVYVAGVGSNTISFTLLPGTTIFVISPAGG